MPNYQREIQAIEQEIKTFYQQRQFNNYKEALGAGRIFAEAVCKLIIQDKIETGVKPNPFSISITDESGETLSFGVKTNITSTEYEFKVSNNPNAKKPYYQKLMLGKIIPIILQILNDNHIINALNTLKDEGNPAHHATGGRIVYSESEWQICEGKLKQITNWMFNDYLSIHGISMSSKTHEILQNKLNRKFLTSDIPNINIDEVIGRGDDLQNLENLLHTNNKVVLVNGIGGIGKTYLAKTYLEINKNNFDHIIYIEQSTTIESAFVSEPSLSNNLLLEFSETDNESDKFEKILNTLRNDYKRKGIIIVDNIDDKIKNVITKFPNTPNWTIIFTSRNTIPGINNYNLNKLKETDAIVLFHFHYKREVVSDEQIKQVISLVNFHTITIVLLAKTLQAHRGLSLEDLYDKLITKGLNINNKIFIEIDHSIIGNQRIYLFDCLLTIFNISSIEQDVISIDILRKISILPSTFIKYHDFQGLINIKEDNLNNSLNKLIEQGWIEEENGFIKCHLVIQDVLRYKLSPDFESCKSVILYLNALLLKEDTNLNFTKEQYYLNFNIQIFKYSNIQIFKY